MGSWHGRFSKAILLRFYTVVLFLFLIVGAERVAHPIGRQQNPAQVRVILEVNPNEVEGFPLVPVGGTPEVSYAWYGGQLCRISMAGHNDLQHQVMLVGNGRKIINNLHRVRFQAIVDARNAGQQVKKQPVIVAQKLANVN